MGHLEKQTNYQVAFERGLRRAQGQSRAALAGLGAQEVATGRYALPVLDTTFVVDLAEGTVRLAASEETALQGADIRVQWRILALHYLGASPPWPNASRWVSFADFQEARGYDPVYRGRVVAGLCATVGRNRDTFVEACHRLGGERVDWGDEGFRFHVFPQLPVTIAWYRGDDELPPNVSFTYRDNALSFLPVEDVVVLSEGLISRLQGKGW